MNIREHIQLINIYQIVSEGLLLEFDTESFLTKVKGIKALIDRGGTEGEKEAAKSAMLRFDARAKIETEYMSPQEKAAFIQRFNAIKGGGAGGTGAGMNRDETSAWRRDAQEREARQREREAREKATRDLHAKREREQAQKDNSQNTDDDDSPYPPSQPRYKTVVLFYFARYVDEENNNDKVYGVFFNTIDKEYYTCWGRHKGKLSTKMMGSLGEGSNIFSTKLKKGYRNMPVNSNLAGYVWNNLDDSLK